jgi:hypothetical protein
MAPANARWVMIFCAALIGLLFLGGVLRLGLPEEQFWGDYGTYKIAPESNWDPDDPRGIRC